MKPCPFCQQPPVVHQSPREPAWYQVACASNECSGREVRTHRCGSREEAEKLWDDRVEPGDQAVEVTIKGAPVRLSKAERDDLIAQLGSSAAPVLDAEAAR